MNISANVFLYYRYLSVKKEIGDEGTSRSTYESRKNDAATYHFEQFELDLFG